MTTQYLITVSWAPEPTPIDAEALECSALPEIAGKIADGYTCGTLHDNLRQHPSDPTGVNYTGTWVVKVTKELT